MLTAQREQKTRIELELSGDVLFAMRGFGNPDVIRYKLKLALAVFLFQEGTISLGKAIELTEMHRTQFITLLNEHGIGAYDYTDQDFEWDQDAVAAYRHVIQS